MRNRLLVLFLILSLLLSLSLLISCSGKAYEYQFDNKDIKKLSIINSETSEEKSIDSSVFEDFFEGLKELNYKSYTGQIRGKESRTITILLNDGTSYSFEAYFIVRKDNKAKYKCDAEKFNAFLDKYVSS